MVTTRSAFRARYKKKHLTVNYWIDRFDYVIKQLFHASAVCMSCLLTKDLITYVPVHFYFF